MRRYEKRRVGKSGKRKRNERVEDRRGSYSIGKEGIRKAEKQKRAE